MRSIVRFVNPGTASSSCELSGSLVSSACLVPLTSVGAACVTPASPSSTTCLVEGTASANCLGGLEPSGLSSSCLLATGPAYLTCLTGGEAGSACLTPSIASPSCLTQGTVASTCLLRGTLSGSCLGSPGSDGLSPVKIGPSVNHIKWRDDQEPDWLVIRPKYAAVAGCEIRSVVYLTLKALKSPTSPAYTFPSAQELLGFDSATALRGLVANGSVLSYNTAATGVFPFNTNIEASYPTFIGGYQTDTFTGPSEKILINVKRLRALGFDLFDLSFGVHYINTNFGAKTVPIELSLYKGGYPSVISTGGSTTDWNFPGSTLITRETLYTRDVKGVTSLATTDYMMTFNVSLVQRYLIFYPLT